MRQRDPCLFFPFFSVCGKYPENKVLLLLWFEMLFHIKLNIFTGWLCIKHFTLWRSQKQFPYRIFNRKANYSVAHKIFSHSSTILSPLRWNSLVNFPWGAASEGHSEVQLRSPPQGGNAGLLWAEKVKKENSERVLPCGSSNPWGNPSQSLFCGRNPHPLAQGFKRHF